MHPSDPCSNLPPPGYMLETDVKAILQNFNGTLAGFALQVDELTRSKSVLTSRLATEEKHNREMKVRMNDMQVELDHTRVQLHLKEVEVERLQTMTNRQMEAGFDEIRSSQSQIEVLRPNLSASSEGLEALSIMNRLLNEIHRLTSLNWTISAETQRLKEELLKRENAEAQPIKCFKCKLFYVPHMNSKESCVFHSGKLKYYSCKGCGADAYYTCCNMCERCSKGCRTGPHATMS
mmetsp:Transcript_6528/g.11431  ORF Transcript_6528/g.11431 Transcript_6528/m.11431 type:complete len:235 (+) Transcript_6528:655-1359(+)